MDLGFKDKVALVTGAGSQVGFGKAIALTLAREGCNVIVNDINIDDAQKTAAEIEALGVKSLAMKADVTKKMEVEEMVQEGLAVCGKIDILVNNAGAIHMGGPLPGPERGGLGQGHQPQPQGFDVLRSGRIAKHDGSQIRKDYQHLIRNRQIEPSRDTGRSGFLNRSKCGSYNLV